MGSLYLAIKFTEFYRYQVERILKNKQVQNYLYNVFHNSKYYNDEMSFSYLFRYGEKNNFFDEEFYNPLSENYTARLSFRDNLLGK